MKLEDFDTVTAILKKVYYDLDYNDPDSIIDLVKENEVENAFQEMQELGLIIERKKKNDYFVPWHQNLYGDNTIDSVRHELVNKELEKDEEYNKLLEEETRLKAELSEVLGKIGEKRDKYNYHKVELKSSPNNGLSIAEQIRSLGVIDDGKSAEDRLVEQINGHPLSANPLYDYAEAGML